uniref:Polynucleotide 5'-hydroxyl-kinase NOL9 n=1 Tax=Crocodylus porosus TaxID=8502 RepID=A0A7M4EWV9_CROPO
KELNACQHRCVRAAGPGRRWCRRPALSALFALSLQRLTFTGRCRLRCLYGSARVLGFAVTPEQPAYDLFSPLTHCALSVEALRRTGPARPRARKEARAALRDHGVPRDARRKLMGRFAPACSVVLLERLDTPVTRFILSHPDFAHLFRSKVCAYLLSWQEDAALASVGVLKCDPESGLLVSESTVLAIEELVQACREENDGVPVILVCGPKCVGKSTFNRYLINLLLNHLPCVEYLECDLGQTEFTPPGCVSLMNISDPFLGPPFTHQRTPRKMVYYGDVSCDQDTERYIDTVKYVFNSYKKEVPLVINTMGWVKGVGLLLLIDIIRLLSPSHIVQISAEDFKDMPQFTPEYIHLTAGLHTKGKLQATCKSMDMGGTENWQSCEGERDFQASTPGHKLLCIKPKFPGAGNAAKARVHSSILRDMAMLGYLGQLQPLETKSVLPLHSLVPYQVPFSAVALRVIHTDVAPKHIIYSVNASWVGLCRIPDEVRCQTDGPVLLTQTPVCDCLGFVCANEREQNNAQTPWCLHCVPVCVFQQGIEGEIPYVTSEYNYQISGAGKLKMKKHLQRREYSRP